MRALGWDCGNHLAWAVVSDRTGFVSGGELEAPVVNGTLYRRVAEIILADGAITLIAVEFAKGKAHGEDDPKKAAAKSSCLIHANDVAGFVTGIAHASFSWPSSPMATVCRYTAPEWRKGIVGKMYPSDAEIARAVRTRVKRIPRCSEHVRDAVGVAVYALAERQLIVRGFQSPLRRPA
jgi:hypothetical protein